VPREGSLNAFTKGLTGNSTLAILRAIKSRIIKVMPRKSKVINRFPYFFAIVLAFGLSSLLFSARWFPPVFQHKNRLNQEKL
jgi:hypothetical protein